MNRHRNLFSIVNGKSKMGRYKFENLLIEFLIIRQRKKMSSKNQPECAFYKKNRPECAFSLFYNTVNDKISDPENNGYIESWNKISDLLENHVTK